MVFDLLKFEFALAEFSSLDPDELPTLVEAIKILFPSLRDSNTSGLKTKGEEDYEIEMNETAEKASTPDCATHMEDLAWQYPAEPVERAAVHFCEAMAKWRGKPELETYKKKPSATPSSTLDVVGTGNTNLNRRKKTPKKPSIDVYSLQGMGRKESISMWNRPTLNRSTTAAANTPANNDRCGRQWWKACRGEEDVLMMYYAHR